MPIISIFFGITIRMHYRDHNPPHFHAEYQGLEGLISIETGRLIQGDLPPKIVSMLRRWVMKRKRELLENWRRARAKEPLYSIPGADYDS